MWPEHVFFDLYSLQLLTLEYPILICGVRKETFVQKKNKKYFLIWKNI